MPWQTAPALMIIAGAFTLTGAGLALTDRLAYGQVGNEFIYSDYYFLIIRRFKF